MAAKRTEATQATRYRILAAEAHSWSSLLLEDERGQRYLYVVGTKALTKVGADSADDLLARRAYRPWRGERSLAPLDQLPLLKQSLSSPASVDAAITFSTGSHQGDAQTS
jgi:hypothetical protein